MVPETPRENKRWKPHVFLSVTLKRRVCVCANIQNALLASQPSVFSGFTCFTPGTLAFSFPSLGPISNFFKLLTSIHDNIYMLFCTPLKHCVVSTWFGISITPVFTSVADITPAAGADDRVRFRPRHHQHRCRC